MGPAEHAGIALQKRLETIGQRAQTEGSTYTIQFRPTTGKVVVTEWVLVKQQGQKVPQCCRQRREDLPLGIVVEHTSLTNHRLTISERGFPLENGRIILRAQDGSRYALDIGLE